MSNLSDHADALKEANGGVWGNVSGHLTEDWRDEAINDDTRLGYWEWAANRIDSGEFEEEEAQLAEEAEIADGV